MTACPRFSNRLIFILVLVVGFCFSSQCEELSFSGIKERLEQLMLNDNVASVEATLSVIKSDIETYRKQVSQTDEGIPKLNLAVYGMDERIKLLKNKGKASLDINIARGIGSAVGAVLIGAGSYFFYQMFDNLGKYATTMITDEAIEYREKTLFSRDLSIVLASSGLGAFSIGFVIPLITGANKRLNSANLQLRAFEAKPLFPK